MHTFDIIVIGSGIAGLSFAHRAALEGFQVGIITKKTGTESNTNYAQGGISCVTAPGDDFESHVNDTLNAGDSLCDEAVVRTVVQEGPECVEQLAQKGVMFCHLEDGRISLGREGGHSKRRILHVKDMTGKAIEDALLDAVGNEKNITLLEHHFAIDLITNRRLKDSGQKQVDEKDRVLGLYALDVRNNKVDSIHASVVLLATGGIGQVYCYTTNPSIATGDGIAIAYRAGAIIQNMEFIQFHPTTLYTQNNQRFLISEAIRGEGAVLRNLQGQTFMKRYHEKAELAPRDIVARAIDNEMKCTGAPYLWLDITHRTETELKNRFPNIYQKCMSHDINIAQSYIPVVPAAHYLCGGIQTNLNGETNIVGLYACGEVACTGLHGANRLASNSLLEAVVMANRTVKSVTHFLKSHPLHSRELPNWITGKISDSDERVVLVHNSEELKRAMWNYVGIVRTTKRLERARTRINHLAQEINDYYWNFKVDTSLLELRNLIQVADLIVQCALSRKESRGLHYTLDYLQKNTVCENTTIQRQNI